MTTWDVILTEYKVKDLFEDEPVVSIHETHTDNYLAKSRVNSIIAKKAVEFFPDKDYVNDYIQGEIDATAVVAHLMIDKYLFLHVTECEYILFNNKVNTVGCTSTCSITINRVVTGETVRGYKAFDENLRCRNDFQYEIGKEYEMEERPILAQRGFHFCWILNDCYRYHEPDDIFGKPRICIVEATGDIAVSDDICCTNKIKIIKELKMDYTQKPPKAIGGIDADI